MHPRILATESNGSGQLTAKMTVQVSELEKKPNCQQTRNNPGFKDFISRLRMWIFQISLIPMFLAASLIYKRVGSVDWPLLLLMVITVLFLRIIANPTNTYYDYVNGVGSYDTCLVEGHLTTKHVLWMLAVSICWSVLGVAMVVAVSPARTEQVVYIFLGMVALNYTGGLGMKYIALSLHWESALVSFSSWVLL